MTWSYWWQWCWWHRYVGDFMMVTDLRCWLQNHYVGDFFRYVGDFLYVLNHNPNLELTLAQYGIGPNPNLETRTLWPGQYFQFSKCRTVGRHAGDHHGSPFPHRVWCVDISEHIYRHISLSVNSFFTKPLLFINSLILVKVKYFSF